MNNSVQIVYTRLAERELHKLPKVLATRILKKIVENTEQSDVLTRAKPLTGQFIGCYRYRIGDYRVIFVVNSQRQITVLTILSIKHRKDVYR